MTTITIPRETFDALREALENIAGDKWPDPEMTAEEYAREALAAAKAVSEPKVKLIPTAEELGTPVQPQAQADRKSWLIEITAGAIAPAWLCGPDMRIGWTKNANAAISFPSNEVAEEVFARLMDKPRWRSLGFDKSCYAITEHLFVDAHPQSSEPA